MIKRVPEAAEAEQVTLLLAPNRALSRSALRQAVGALVLASFAVAVLAAWQGNVFAPLFALVELPAVTLALGLAWHAGDRAERITLDARSLRIESIPRRGTAIAFPSPWVRMRWREWGGHRHLLLAASGREREVGAFLGDEERMELSRELRDQLAAMSKGKIE